MTTSHAARRPEADLAGDWNDLVVVFAANYWHGMRYQDRHIAEHLSKDRPVLYVDPPLSRLALRNHPGLAQAIEGPRLRRVAPRIARLTPLTPPGPDRPGMGKLTSAIVRRRAASAVRELGGTVNATLATSPFHDVFAAFPDALKIYWAQDDLAGGADLLGLDADRIRKGEARRAAAADELIVANPAVADYWTEHGYRPHLIPFGCDDEHYANVDRAPLPTDVTVEGPIVGFVGLLGSRIEFALMEAVAERGHSLLLVGPRHWKFDIERVDRLLARPNVCWVGRKDFEDLPSYLRMIDVGIVPYADSAFNRGSFPLKTLEYLSAGRAAVVTDLPAIRWINTDLIHVATGPADFADAVDAELARPRTATLMEQRRSVARRHSWANAAAGFAAIIDRAPTS